MTSELDFEDSLEVCWTAAYMYGLSERLNNPFKNCSWDCLMFEQTDYIE